MIVLDCATRLPAALKPADLRRLGDEMSGILRLRKPRHVGVSFVTENAIQKLNKTYRKINKPTDVLSFNPDPAVRKAGKEGRELLGDLVLCPTYAKHEASKRQITLREELLRLLAHGILHLSGYDHVTLAQEKRMFGLQEQAVKKVL